MVMQDSGQEGGTGRCGGEDIEILGEVELWAINMRDASYPPYPARAVLDSGINYYVTKDDSGEEPGWNGMLGTSLFKTEKDAHHWRKDYFRRRLKFYEELYEQAYCDWFTCADG